jgi:exodeoxyribonuclease VII small subunit
MAQRKTADTVRFEASLAALEAIVAQLESGELPLEEALQAFERGVGLVRQLNEKLGEAEKRIELLSRAEDDTLRLETDDEDEG